MSHPTVSPQTTGVVERLEPGALWLSAYSDTVNPEDGTRLTSDSEQASSPEWGPNDWIAFEQVADNGEHDIAVGNIDSHVRCVLAGFGDTANPTWAPEAFAPDAN
jgi:hypothetical protein